MTEIESKYRLEDALVEQQINHARVWSREYQEQARFRDSDEHRLQVKGRTMAQIVEYERQVAVIKTNMYRSQLEYAQLVSTLYLTDASDKVKRRVQEMIENQVLGSVQDVCDHATTESLGEVPPVLSSRKRKVNSV
jgi:hypothetical protein